MPRLILRRKTEILKEFIISKAAVTVGQSDDNDIVINDQPISLRHCEIFELDGKYFVKDSKSAFGTYVNNKRISQSEIQYGDVVNFSDSPFDILFYPALDEYEKVDALPPRYFLIAVHGKLFGKKFELYKGETKIGRDDEFNDIVIPGKLDASVSRRHATVHLENNEISISDKRSRNRTFVNQTVVGESTVVPVQLNDEILIGHNIFRLVKEGFEDYSAPRKAGIFLDRYKAPALKFSAAVLVLAGILAVFYSSYRILVIKKLPVPLDIKFSEFIPKVELLGLTDYDQEYFDITPALAVGTRGKIKNKSLVVSARNGSIYSLNPASGLSTWPGRFSISEGISGSPIMIDVNSDNIDDIIVCGNDSRLYVIDGYTGELIYRSQILGGVLSSTPAAADFDGDGLVDVVCVSEDGVVLFVYNPSGSAKEISVNLNSKTASSPVVYKDKKSKRNKVAVALLDGKVCFIDGFDRNYYTIDTAEGINKRRGTTLTSNELLNTPIIHDINNDGDMEMITVSRQQFVTCFNINNMNLIWDYQITEQPVKELPKRLSSPVAADLNSDGILDIVIPWHNGRVYAINGKNGALLWRQQTEEWNRIIGSAALADINKDGTADIVFAGENGFVYIVDGAAHLGVEVNRIIYREKISPGPITSPPVIADINGNGFFEIMVKNDLNKIYLASSNTRVIPGDSPWSMFRAGPDNSGVLVIKNLFSFFAALIAAALLAVAGIFVAAFVLNKKKGVMKPQVVSLKEEVTN